MKDIGNFFEGLWDDILDFRGPHDEKAIVTFKGAIANVGSKTFSSYEWDADESGMNLKIPIPGVNPSCVSIVAKDNKIFVTLTKDEKSYTNKYSLSGEYDVKKSTAKITFGMLTISIPKVTDAQSVVIEIPVSY